MGMIELNILSNDGELSVRTLVNRRFIKSVMEYHPSMTADFGVPETAGCIIAIDGDSEVHSCADNYESLKWQL